jgi:hypothetical protein
METDLEDFWKEIAFALSFCQTEAAERERERHSGEKTTWIKA